MVNNRKISPLAFWAKPTAEGSVNIKRDGELKNFLLIVLAFAALGLIITYWWVFVIIALIVIIVLVYRSKNRATSAVSKNVISEKSMEKNVEVEFFPKEAEEFAKKISSNNIVTPAEVVTDPVDKLEDKLEEMKKPKEITVFDSILGAAISIEDLAWVLGVDEADIMDLVDNYSIDEGCDYLLLEYEELSEFRADNVGKRDIIGNVDEFYVFPEEGVEKCAWIFGKDIDVKELFKW